MQDQYAGQAGTFIVDPDRGVRVPIEQWQAEQAAQAASALKARAKAVPELESPSEPTLETE
jgi:hypothetical protein